LPDTGPPFVAGFVFLVVKTPWIYWPNQNAAVRHVLTGSVIAARMKSRISHGGAAAGAAIGSVAY